MRDSFVGLGHPGKSACDPYHSDFAPACIAELLRQVAMGVSRAAGPCVAREPLEMPSDNGIHWRLTLAMLGFDVTAKAIRSIGH